MNTKIKEMVGKKKVYSVAGVLLVAGLSIGGVLLTGADEKQQKSLNVKDTTMPSAGIAVLFDEHETTDNSDKSQLDLTGGIATVLRDYYNNTDIQTVTIEKVEKVLSMLPQEEPAQETKTEQEVKTEQEEQGPVKSVVDGYTVLGVANVTNYLNVRETPDEGGTLLGKLPMNAGCEILETLDGWYKISSGNVEGYVCAEYLLTGKEANDRAMQAMAKVAHVNADMLMVREETNTDCRILTCVAEGEEIEVVEELDGWVKVNIDDVTGFVKAEFVNVYQTLPKGVTLKELSYGEGISNTAVDLIEYAKQFLGNPYVWGGTSLTNGTDCSGFTMRIFQHFGYSLSRTSREQAYNGTRVSLSEIQPGDLLFYSHGGTIGHVAIYIGDGQIIHASTERTGIIISNAFYTTPTCATRIIN